jgi:hypothetical protein
MADDETKGGRPDQSPVKESEEYKIQSWTKALLRAVMPDRLQQLEREHGSVEKIPETVPEAA